MADIKGQEGEIHMTLQIKRAETGKIEEHKIIGKIVSVEQKPILGGQDNGGNS